MPADLAVVLDTNVWISGIFFRRGVPARILAAWRDHHFKIVVTPDTLAELETQLRQNLQALDTYQRVKVFSPREFVELIGL